MQTILYYFLNLLYTIPVLLIAFPVHECSHALVAKWMGDPTAKNMGRLTLNPMKHLDLFGTICLIFTNFGWAKPVPVNPNNFRNRKEGMAITALAGPVSNFIMGFLSVFFLLKLQVWVPGTPDIVLTFLYYSAIINTGLSIFNLIPIMPLDGSRILAYFLPERLEAALAQYGTYIQLGLLLLLFTGILSGPLSTMVNTLLKNFDYLVRLIP